MNFPNLEKKKDRIRNSNYGRGGIEMKKRMESDLLLKIISVVFAFLLWMFVINTDNPVIKKTFSDVPVDMLNEQVLDDLNQTYKIESGDTVSFTVKGKKDVVDRLTKSDFRATADVSSMSDVHAIQMKLRLYDTRVS